MWFRTQESSISFVYERTKFFDFTYILMYDLHNLCAFIKDFKMFFICETETKLKL